MDTKNICEEIAKRLELVNTRKLIGCDKALLLSSEEHNGLQLKHTYNSVFYAMLDPDKLYLAENATELFMSYQTAQGQLPSVLCDGDENGLSADYSAVGEGVSFAYLCLVVYRMNGDRDYLKRAYVSAEAWVCWLEKNKMASGPSMLRNPEADRNNALPIILVEENCNFYGTLSALSVMAEELGLEAEADAWSNKAYDLKNSLLSLCLNKEESFFYDIDKDCEQIKRPSSSVFALFYEGVLDIYDDRELIGRILESHLNNTEEFNTPYPYPALTSDLGEDGKAVISKGTDALRAILWMEEYGMTAEFDRLCSSWLSALSGCYDDQRMPYAIDSLTGEPLGELEWYTPTMLFYLYASKRIEEGEEE